MKVIEKKNDGIIHGILAIKIVFFLLIEIVLEVIEKCIDKLFTPSTTYIDGNNTCLHELHDLYVSVL